MSARKITEVGWWAGHWVVIWIGSQTGLLEEVTFELRLEWQGRSQPRAQLGKDLRGRALGKWNALRSERWLQIRSMWDLGSLGKECGFHSNGRRKPWRSFNNGVTRNHECFKDAFGSCSMGTGFQFYKKQSSRDLWYNNVCTVNTAPNTKMVTRYILLCGFYHNKKRDRVRQRSLWLLWEERIKRVQK